MPAVTEIYAAMADDAPQLYDCYKYNIVFDWHAGNHAAADAAFAAGIQNGWQRVDIDVVNSRVVINALDIRHVDMPVTPQKIFDILHNRQAGTEAK